MKLVWNESAWDDYGRGRPDDSTDRKVLKRINTLITDVEWNGNEGIGKPGPRCPAASRLTTSCQACLSTATAMRPSLP